MKVLPINPISFKSIPLYDVKLRKQNSDGNFEEIPATFSKLDFDDENDISDIECVCKSWHNAPFAVSAARDFLMDAEDKEKLKRSYYVVEGADDKGERKIYSIAEFNRYDKKIELCQSNPKNKQDNIKGSGELILYGITRHNKPQKGYETLSLDSSDEAVEFYKKIGWAQFYGSFLLSPKMADEFLQRIEKKYNLDTEA